MIKRKFHLVVGVYWEEQFCRDGFRSISPESVLQDGRPQSAGLEELTEQSGADEENTSNYAALLPACVQQTSIPSLFFFFSF